MSRSFPGLLEIFQSNLKHFSPHWMTSTQLAPYNACTSRPGGYSYSTSLPQQSMQSVPMINSSYNTLPSTINGEKYQFYPKWHFNWFYPPISDYYLPPSVSQSSSSPSTHPCSTTTPRRFDTSAHSLTTQFYPNWDPVTLQSVKEEAHPSNMISISNNNIQNISSTTQLNYPKFSQS